MKAVLSKETGGPETLVVEEIDTPTAGSGEVLVKVAACAINFPDTLIIRDMYQFKPPRPFAPGGEISGTIEALGEGVTDFAVGDRVMCGVGNGGLQEKVVVPAAKLFKVPDGIDLVKASALLMTYGTTIHGLKDRGDIKEGETVLVLGAAGGVGLSAVELAKAYGCRVVAAVSTEEKGAVARKHGADEVVIYPRAPFDKDTSKQLANDFKAAVGPDGANIVYDIVGGDYSEPALRAIAWEGRFLVVGFPAGIAKMPLNLTLLKSCDIRGVFWGAFRLNYTKEDNENFEQLFAWYAQGKLKPFTSKTYTLSEAALALNDLKNRKAIGKLIIQISS